MESEHLEYVLSIFKHHIRQFHSVPPTDRQLEDLIGDVMLSMEQEIKQIIEYEMTKGEE